MKRKIKNFKKSSNSLNKLSLFQKMIKFQENVLYQLRMLQLLTTKRRLIKKYVLIMEKYYHLPPFLENKKNNKGDKKAKTLGLI